MSPGGEIMKNDTNKEIKEVKDLNKKSTDIIKANPQKLNETEEGKAFKEKAMERIANVEKKPVRAKAEASSEVRKKAEVSIDEGEGRPLKTTEIKKNVENKRDALNYKDMPTFDSDFISITTDQAALNASEKYDIAEKLHTIMDGIKNNTYVVDKIQIVAKESQVPSKNFEPGQLMQKRGALTFAYLRDLATAAFDGDTNKINDFMNKISITLEPGTTPYAGEIPGTQEYNAKYAKEEGIHIKIDGKEKLPDPSLEGVNISVKILEKNKDYGTDRAAKVSAGAATENALGAQFNSGEGFIRMEKGGKVGGGFKESGKDFSKNSQTIENTFKVLAQKDAIKDNAKNVGKSVENQRPDFVLVLDDTTPAGEGLIQKYKKGEMQSKDGMKELLGVYVTQQEKLYSNKLDPIKNQLNILNITISDELTSAGGYESLRALVDRSIANEPDLQRKNQIIAARQQLDTIKQLADNVVQNTQNARTVLNKL